MDAALTAAMAADPVDAALVAQIQADLAAAKADEAAAGVAIAEAAKSLQQLTTPAKLSLSLSGVDDTMFSVDPNMILFANEYGVWSIPFESDGYTKYKNENFNVRGPPVMDAEGALTYDYVNDVDQFQFPHGLNLGPEYGNLIVKGPNGGAIKRNRIKLVLSERDDGDLDAETTIVWDMSETAVSLIDDTQPPSPTNINWMKPLGTREIVSIMLSGQMHSGNFLAGATYLGDSGSGLVDLGNPDDQIDTWMSKVMAQTVAFQITMNRTFKRAYPTF